MLATESGQTQGNGYLVPFVVNFCKTVSPEVVIESLTPTYERYVAENGSVLTNRIDTLTVSCVVGDTGVISGQDALIIASQCLTLLFGIYPSNRPFV